MTIYLPSISVNWPLISDQWVLDTNINKFVLILMGFVFEIWNLSLGVKSLQCSRREDQEIRVAGMLNLASNSAKLAQNKISYLFFFTPALNLICVSCSCMSVIWMFTWPPGVRSWTSINGAHATHHTTTKTFCPGKSNLPSKLGQIGPKWDNSWTF